ncbi:gametocyte-specific factor 1 homolog [Drosophila eugracilis]|uniref:gametocyte-specific factor 1 homolog n=1 Tax=Drosophila eugracilis TaxID=29029 RepID=UPI0007E79BCB|nr:gametocyte-specific factor 1 homolog [Drosophila eugracilis]
MNNFDESDMVYCPYNKEHKMLRKKLQQHILKCRVIYKDTVELMVCPFNKTHLIPEPEFFQHTKACEDRKIIVDYQTNGSAELNEDTKHAKIECEENWDDDNDPVYDPQTYCSTANIVREPCGLFPSQRKAFIKEENRRHFGEDYKEEKRPPKAKNRVDTRFDPYECRSLYSRRQ